ncbi:MAG: class I SAM-dependent methyltransferase [Chloroflexi bacterium]|nr:MAG: class I SAM-dependent methyltransferase [Chloroflexota bacterium]
MPVMSAPARRGEYGVDAPYVPAYMALGALALLLTAALSAALEWSAWSFFLSGALYLVASIALYLYASRVGKFAIWSEILDQLRLRGDERVLDLGCGRGAVLLLAAQRVPRGGAVGIDLWKTADQSGNSEDATLRNAALEGVRDRIELRTADMRALPFADGEFDVVLSSLAIHNITDAAGRLTAIDEAVRVLGPDGRIAIADIAATDAYAERLRRAGCVDVSVRSLGWRAWYGGPWVAGRLVRAKKPAR